MKNRYFLLPVIIVSIMIFIIDREEIILNKEIMISNYHVSYPFFNNDKIDNYIFNYLNDEIDNREGNIYYELIEKDNMYYLTFYKEVKEDNILITSSGSFIINDSIIDKYYK